jgi:tetratricopeptide (TPR) repeat protein/predicted Ser/Thr protein kinase
MDDKKTRPDPGVPKELDASGRKTRFAGESSSGGTPPPLEPDSQDPDLTIVDAGFKTPEPDATMADLDATLVPGMLSPTPRSPSPSPSPRRPLSGLFASAAVFQIGDVLGERYEILSLLGEGGMGAVYKAADRELGRPVALKVIRSELALNPKILARFKQELLLAHQVTHRNAVRVYDLGEAAGVKFITMEFVEGSDLRSLLLKHGKFSPEEAVEMERQICLALDAAHSVGVIHRDLKPQNVMRDQNGRILVMDFGLARSLESDGMTQTGALVGTMEYMSPEQAMGKELDQRSDIFAAGLVFYELLSGKMPYKADTAVASLVKRSQERAIPLSEIDASVPRGLSDIVSKCLERDVEQRYQNVREVLTDLEAWQAGRPLMASGVRSTRDAASTVTAIARERKLPWKWITTAAAVLLLGSGIWFWKIKPASTAGTKVVQGRVTSLAILPFRNASGDPTLDWYSSTIAEMLTTDVGQSASLRTVSADRVHQILNDLHMTGNVQFDPTTLRQVSESSNADTVISGQFMRFGEQIRIDATLQDLRRERRIPLKIDASSEKDIPNAVDRLAELIRQNLSVSPDVVKELQAQSFRPSSGSMEALRAYNEGIELSRQGNNQDALKRFQDAVKQDPEFALAYSKVGQTYAALGYDEEADKAARKAVDLSTNLPSRERYLIVASQARIANDNQKAIQYYSDMAKASPQDTDIQFALGSLYSNTGAYDEARTHFENVLQRDPQYSAALLEIARVEIRSGHAPKGLDYLNRAYSLATQRDNQEEIAASLQVMGLAYEALNKPQEALDNFEKSLAIKRKINQLRGSAASLNEIGNVQSQLGKVAAAQAAFQEALDIRRKIGDKRGVGATLLDFGNFIDDRGDHDKALKSYKESLQIQRDLGNESLQAICLNNIGSIYFSTGQYDDALTYFQQALQLREKFKVPGDIVESVHNVAETSVMMGRFEQAISEYMRALELRRSTGDTRGAAIESYSIGKLFSYEGRFGAALKSKKDALDTFRDLKDRTFWMAEILGGYGIGLVLAGQGDASKNYLDEALSLSQEIKNDGMISQALSWQGDVFYIQGDPKSARPLYERALRAANKTAERDKVLIAQVNLAKVDVQEGRGGSALSSLRRLVQQAQELGLKYIALECSIYMAEAMMQTRDLPAARQELERALTQSERLGLNPLTLRAHFQLGNVLRQTGNVTEAQDHYRQALRILDTMRKDPGAEKLMQRPDLTAISNEANRQLQAQAVKK